MPVNQKMCHLSILLPALLVALSFSLSSCDYYSSITGLELLLEAESEMVDAIETYLNAEKLKHDYLKSVLSFVETDLWKAKNSSVFSYGNPLYQLKLLKRLSKDWPNYYAIRNTITNEQEYANKLNSIMKEGFKKPLLEDLVGAGKGVGRLQHTYKMKTRDLANGVLMGIKLSTEMSASDCYDLGMTLIAAENYKLAVEWLSEARVRLKREAQTGITMFPYLADETILGRLAEANFGNGNIKLAILLTKELLEREPLNRNASQNVLTYEQHLKAQRSAFASQNKQQKSQVDEMYEQTCSGELKQTPAEQRDLTCQYVHNGEPFCFIAPLKEEELSLDPVVSFYHEAIYENEIEYILVNAEGNVERSQVSVDPNDSQVSDVRTSKQTWFYPADHVYLRPLARRIQDITGLSLETAEALQVANYGIGGHYGPHFDFFEDENSDLGGVGNRLLTAMFYINHVEMGGATAFPFLRLAVPPIRRGMVMWFNMHQSLELDYRTRHAGCPVIKGSKWIINQWFRERGQEFLLPCSLEEMGHESIQYKGYW